MGEKPDTGNEFLGAIRDVEGAVCALSHPWTDGIITDVIIPNDGPLTRVRSCHLHGKVQRLQVSIICIRSFRTACGHDHTDCPSTVVEFMSAFELPAVGAESVARPWGIGVETEL